MTVFDSTQFSPFYKVFSELTVAQCETVIFFAVGATPHDIANLRGVSPRQVVKCLREAQERLFIFSKSSLRVLILTRILLYLGVGILIPGKGEPPRKRHEQC